MTPDAPGAPINTRRLTLTLGAVQLLSWATSFYLPAVIGRAVAESFGVSLASVLGAFSWSLLVAAACAPRVGRWIGRRGGRVALATGAGVMALGLVVLAAATGLPGWYAGWTILGIGMAMGLYDAAFATAGVLLGTAVGPVVTGITLIAGFASTVGWPAGVALLQALGWRGVLLAYAALHLGVNLPLVLGLVPRGIRIPHVPAGIVRGAIGRRRAVMAGCLAGFFAIRWFITSAIAVHILPLMGGLGLSHGEALGVAMLIGPGQVAGRLLEWGLARRIGPMGRAWFGAMLFPAGALVLLAGGPAGAAGFVLLYGMSNGILTVNRGTLPMVVLGPAGYAAVLGALAVPVLIAQAAAPAVVAPLVAAVPAWGLLLLAGGVAGAAAVLLVPLRAREG